MYRIDFYAMGNQMSASIDSEAKVAVDMLGQVPAWFARWEQRLSRFRPTSELSQLNSRGEGWHRVSDLLFEHLEIAQQAARYSDGLFDPTTLAVLESLGYDRSFDQLNSIQNVEVEMESVPAAAWSLIELNSTTKQVYLADGLRLDLGGISKAVSAERAAGRLAEVAPALVEAGGDVAVSGERQSGQSWPIAVGSPWQPERDLGWLWLDRGVVATSGSDYRRWTVGGNEVHHLIDPRSGVSAASDVLTATVIAPTSWQAEAGAKVALILGAAEGISWLEAKPELEGLLMLETGEILTTKGIAKYGWQRKGT